MYSDVREVVRGTPDYPAALTAVDEETAPAKLWLRGRVPQGRAMAVVGARAASAGGLVAARTVAAGLAGAEIAVVSGGALGVDGAAHRGALDVGGRTVVVAGTGIDRVYPAKHKALFDEAVARGGGVVTPFPPGFEGTRWSFPKRNAIIAALAEAVIVIEAGGSSGSLHTAAAARRMGKRVIALLGTTGCDRLVAQRQAEGARSAEQILERLLGRVAAESGLAAGGSPFSMPVEEPATVGAESEPDMPVPPVLPEDPRARRIYEALDGTPRDLSEVAARAGVPASEAMAIAIDLELGGFAARAAGGRYLRLG